jgi:hypothetical protein
MSAFYDLASLVLVPSGTKSAKIYAQKPMTTDGQLAFSRSTTATRVGPDGLIEKVRTNVVLQSNTFSNASWTKAGQGVASVSVVTPNYTTDPFGGNNAWRFQCNLNGGTTSNDRSWMLQAFTPIANTILSIYIKLNVAGSKTIIFSNGGGGSQSVTSTDWVRLNVATSGSSGEFRIGLIGGSTSDTLDCSIAFAQAETGDIATDYIATTSAAVSVGPVANVPRLDYLGSTCGKLLLEPQRTNLITYSEQFDNAAWTKDGSTATANDAVSPDGYTNADKLFETAVTDFHRLYGPLISVTSGTAYTASIFVKAAEVTTFAIELRLTASVGTAVFNLVAETATNGGIVQDYGNGWYRCIFTATATATGNGRPFFYIKQASSYAGNASNGILIYGASLEEGAYATSYVGPTLGAAVTRGSDDCSKTGISSLIGQTEGTLFVEMNNVQELDFPEITLDDNTNDNRIVLTRSINGYWGIFTASAGTGVSGYGTTAGNSGKFALAYSAAGYVLYRNGVQVATATAALPVSLSAFRLNGRATSDFLSNKNIAQALLFATRLTNADLAALTA